MTVLCDLVSIKCYWLMEGLDIIFTFSRKLNIPSQYLLTHLIRLFLPQYTNTGCQIWVFVHSVEPVERNLQCGRNSYILLLWILRLLFHMRINQDIIAWSCSCIILLLKLECVSKVMLTYFHYTKLNETAFI